MPSRAAHSKSRHGCTSCKFKRVKCDENKPSCSPCTKQNRPCEYKDIISTQSKTHKFRSPSPNHSATHNSARVPLSWSDVRLLRDQHLNVNPSIEEEDKSSTSTAAPPERWFSTHDLALFFHYTISTSYTLTLDASDKELWQSIISREASTHPFLMFAVLSLSALHKVYLQDDTPRQVEHYHELGIRHGSSSMALFDTFLRRTRLCSATADAIACFVPITSAISLARLSEPSIPTANSVDAILDSFQPIRMLRDRLQLIWQIVEGSPVGLFLFSHTTKCASTEPQSDPAMADIEIALQALEWRVQSYSVVGDRHGSQERNDYSDAVHQLRYALHPHRKVHLLTWPFLLSTRFSQAMGEHEPAALIILGFYGVLLHALMGTWWVGDVGRRIVDAVMSESIPLEWRTLLSWASVKVVGEREQGGGEERIG